MDEKELELFREDGCLTDEGLQALRDGQLDELGRLEAAACHGHPAIGALHQPHPDGAHHGTADIPGRVGEGVGGLPPRREHLYPRFLCAGKPAERG